MRIINTFTAALAAAMVLALLTTSVPVAAAEDWKQLDDMPFQTISFSTAQLPDGKVFFNGGQKEGSTDNSDETWLYDPDTDAWESRASSPLALAGSSAVYMPDGSVYVFCGTDSNLQSDHGVMVYDVADDTWTTIPFIINLGKYREAAALDDSRILLAGGAITHPFMPEDGCMIFDTRFGDFQTAEPLPYPLGYGTMVKVGDCMYYIGGFDGADMELAFSVLRYDIPSGHWEIYGRMSEPHMVGDGVLAGDGLVHLFGSVEYYPNVPMWQALDLTDCSLHPRPVVPTKATGGAIAATTDGRVVLFGGEDQGTNSREVFSLDLYEKEAWLGSVETGPGTSVRVYARFEATSFENEGMTATAYLIKDDIAYGSCTLSAVGNGTASGLLEVPEDLSPGEYEVLIRDVDTGVGVPGTIQFDPLSLTVTGSQTPTDRMAELQEQLSLLRGELNDTRSELADLQDSSDGKMDAWVGYAILALAAAAVVLLSLQVLRRRTG
jgi:hypothetical protein